MATQITNFQCPSCTGPLRFAEDSGLLRCDHCGSSYEVALIEQLYADKEQAAASAGSDARWDVSGESESWSEEEAAHLRMYSCPSCGAELICDDTTAATSCPYCGNPSVVPGQFTGQLKPDYVIPFRFDKTAAIAALKKHYKGKRFLPTPFAAENHIEEIKGIYVPFWLFDGKTDANIRFRGTISHSHRHGDWEITTTDHYWVAREGNLSFEKVPADGSSKMPDAHMDAVEPFDYTELKPFSTAYLPGFLADKYDVDAGACAERVSQRIRNSTRKALAATAKGYHTLTEEYADIKLSQGEVKYVLMPLWMLSTKWKGKSFLFAMNGQTGKLIGDLPVNWGKFWAWFAGISVPVMAILASLLFLGGGIL